MDFKERLKIVEEILKDSPYGEQKETIMKLFEKTKNNKKEDIQLRLIVIDSCYSTNMSKRLFGFEELTKLILKIEPQLKTNIDVNKFIEKNFEQLKSPIGIQKNGKNSGHALSIITKYIYFRTKFTFPICDKLVFNELKKEDLIKNTQEYSKEFFKKLIMLKTKYKVSFDELDKYFWVCGKVRKGSLSLLIPSIKSYKEDYFNKLKLDKNKTSNEINKIVSKKLISKKEIFTNKRLKLVQKLAKSIEKENVFGHLI